MTSLHTTDIGWLLPHDTTTGYNSITTGNMAIKCKKD